MITQQITRVLAALPLRTGRVSIVPASLLCLITFWRRLSRRTLPRPSRRCWLPATSAASTARWASMTPSLARPSMSHFFRRSPWASTRWWSTSLTIFLSPAARATAPRSSANSTRPPARPSTRTSSPSAPLMRGVLALDGNNHLFVSENGGNYNIVGKYDATTGATINASFIQDLDSPVGLNNPRGVAVDNKNHLFVSNSNANTVGEYDATTGATINAAFIKSQGQGLHDPQVLLLDGLNHLLVGDNYDTATVGMYDATTRTTINAAFVPGLYGGTWALALDGSNHLFVANNNTVNGVGEYDATTGATINEHFITGPHYITGLAFVSPVPEPSTFVLLCVGAIGLLGYALAAPKLS